MTWAFNATGIKEQCASALDASTPPQDPDNLEQYEYMRAVIKKELDHYADGSAEMSIAASGHAPGAGGGSRSFSIWVSGKAAAKAEPAKPEPQAEAPHAEPEHARPARRR